MTTDSQYCINYTLQWINKWRYQPSRWWRKLDIDSQFGRWMAGVVSSHLRLAAQLTTKKTAAAMQLSRTYCITCNGINTNISMCMSAGSWSKLQYDNKAKPNKISSRMHHLGAMIKGQPFVALKHHGFPLWLLLPGSCHEHGLILYILQFRVLTSLFCCLFVI